ncbi:MAG: PIN-like domain-containing protein [Tepidibacter sp.]|uniref:PIN-like domain-containing protein n=1 Tax=Tepidibacter sp. TaxID=2529387 RepID=UPI0025FA1E9F|nr:PIN-like domain-containing protein [Tepidibacter sp.]MCT4507517.1 PIN-like domain-containing protein [Tepidibacter sp.]
MNYIVWKEILRYSSNNNGDILFITNDEKPDWWEMENDKLIGPRKELIEEFKRYNSNKSIHFLTLRDFYSVTSKYYNVLSYITELELNAERYVEEQLIKEIDEEITDTITHHEYDYENYIDYPCNDYDVSYVDYEVKDIDFEVIEKEAVYYDYLKG